LRFKTDENVHPEAAALLRKHGHDALTVWDQNLRGGRDPELAATCREEQRVLLTLDRGFGNIRSYPPEHFPGLIILQIDSQSRQAVVATIERLLPSLERKSLDGCLWVVDGHRIRERRGP
jgi:predicted nuclease of predicted toxin-antitoxin system